MANKKTALTRVQPPVSDDMEMLFKNFMGMKMSPWMPIWKKPYEVTAFPSLDIYEDESHLIIEADLPGVVKEDIDIDVTDHTLTVSGERKKKEEIEDKYYHHVERSYGTFRRSIELPREIDRDKIDASFIDGTLKIR